MSIAVELPRPMELHFSRSFPEKQGSMTIKIHNAGHFADAINFAKENGVEKEFWQAVTYFIQMSLGPTLAQRACVYGEGQNRMEFEARPARDGVIEIAPDCPETPSFCFMQKYDDRRGLAGGIIFHVDSRTWGVHT